VVSGALGPLTIRIWACVGHAESVWLIMPQVGKFVFKFFAPDTVSTSPVSQWIPALDRSVSKFSTLALQKLFAYLNHEFPDHTVKNSIVVISVLCVCHEILHSFWSCFREQP
jgi:hypothetical protein